MIEYKTCNKCKETKSVSMFYKRYDGIYDKPRSLCKKCENRKRHLARKDNPKYIRQQKEKAKEFQKRLREYINSIKSIGCQICGYNKTTEALDFHHLDSSTKEKTIGNCSSWHGLKKEIKKCIVLCANCHRELHAGISYIPPIIIRH